MSNESQDKEVNEEVTKSGAIEVELADDDAEVNEPGGGVCLSCEG